MPEISTAISSRLYYRKMGAGPALFLLHGFPESSALWRKVWDEISVSFTLFIPDFPGSGNSVLERETSIADMADCVKAIMDHEAIDKAVIAGHSMGGYVGFAFADKYPERVMGLSLVHSTPLADDEEKKTVRRKAIEVIRKGGKKAFICQMIPNLFSTDFKQSDPLAVKNQVDMGLEMNDNGIINFYEAMIARQDTTNVLENAIFPVQWIIGIDDNVIYYKRILEQCCKSGTNFVSFYNKCGHMSMIERPEKLASDLSAFVNYCYKLKER